MIKWAIIALALLPIRDDGRFANSPLKPWFESLQSATGMHCCAEADGVVVDDWETHDGHYRVFLKGSWIDVPDEAVLKEPNLAGPTMVWPFYYNGVPQIRCFLPGVMM